MLVLLSVELRLRSRYVAGVKVQSGVKSGIVGRRGWWGARVERPRKNSGRRSVSERRGR